MEGDAMYKMIMFGVFCFDKEIRYYKTSGKKKYLPQQHDFKYKDYRMEHIYIEGEENLKWKAIEEEINDNARRKVTLVNKRIENTIKLSESYAR